jgi:hypothetical protein
VTVTSLPPRPSRAYLERHDCARVQFEVLPAFPGVELWRNYTHVLSVILNNIDHCGNIIELETMKQYLINKRTNMRYGVVRRGCTSVHQSLNFKFKIYVCHKDGIFFQSETMSCQ